jgi:tetratricopeptide (TPR) repeat protein
MAAKSPPSLLHRWWFWAGLALILGAVGVFSWTRMTPAPDMVKVLEANSRGVGHLERFNFAEALESFQEVVRLAPDWLPGRVNLAIALMNYARGDDVPTDQKQEVNAQAEAQFNDVLKRDPSNPYAHFCLGIMIYNQGDVDLFPNAREHFLAVTRVDEHDTGAWYWLGMMALEDADEAVRCYRRALELDPSFNAARFALSAQLRQQGHDAEAQAALEEFQALENENWERVIDTRYWSNWGKYALVIGTLPKPPTAPRTGPLPPFAPADKFQVQLAPGARWAAASDFGIGPVAEFRTAVRQRFGATVAVLDFNRDGKPDLLLLGAVVEGGKVRDLLLRNDGEGLFVDVTAEVGLAGARPSLGCCVADFDNDGFPDLLITGAGEQHLFRNTGKAKFEDVSGPTGLDKLRTVCLGATFVDLDQDGDLDLIVAQYADTAEHALAALKGETVAGDKGLAVFINIGEAKPASKGEDPPPLNPAFWRADGPPALLGEASPAVSVTVSDLDQDSDLDLISFADQTPPTLVLNDRLLRFHRATLAEKQAPPASWNGALVLDVNHDERSDLLLVGPGRGPMLLVRRAVFGEADTSKWFDVVSTNSPPLLQAHAIDIDLDSWTDVVGLSEQRKPVLLHNVGGKLALAPAAFGRDTDWPADLLAVSVADFDCDGLPDLLSWSEGKGLALHVNKGNGNHGLKLELTGHRHVEPPGGVVRCNADGFGARVMVHAGDLWAGAEYTTLSAGLGQSHAPLILGLGRRSEADVIRLRWPDNSLQAEFDSPSRSCEIIRIDQTNRKKVSCPVLFTWDGERFVFVTDFLGEGSMGEMLAGGGHRQPRPEESVKIEADQLVPLKGQYVLKVAEPMDEATYLDRLQLVALDHPADVHVYPDERFASGGPPPTQQLLAFRQQVFPVRATDHRGRDVTATLRQRDRDTVSGFARRSWLGFAEEHAVELDFADRLAGFGPKDRLILCLAGWTDYPYPESIWAATQAGVALQPPVLERRSDDGKWQVIAEAGFPAGLPRVMTLDVTGQFGGPSCVLRLRTNMQVFWDQIYVAPLLETVESGKAGTVRATCLEVASAKLLARGCMQEHSPDGRQPTVYDYDRLEAVPVSRLAGRLTRFGDVTELLRGLDDRFVIFGPGDELDVRFAAQGLPELPSGWRRSFVLRTWGYCKDCSPFTASGDTVGPLPFRGMRDYPYGPDEQYPQPDYDRRFNTRRIGAK